MDAATPDALTDGTGTGVSVDVTEPPGEDVNVRPTPAEAEMLPCLELTPLTEESAGGAARCHNARRRASMRSSSSRIFTL